MKKPVLKLNPLRPGRLPGVKGVKFRGKNGKFSKPERAFYYELKPEGSRKILSGEIPVKYRRSVSARVEWLGIILAKHSKETFEKSAKYRKKQVEKKAKEIKEKEKKLKKAVKKGEVAAVKRYKEKVQAQEILDLEQKEYLKKEGIEKLPFAAPKASSFKGVESVEEARWVVGRNLREKLSEKQALDVGRRGMPRRIGVKDYQHSKMVIEKMHVDFAKPDQVEVMPFNVRGVAAGLKSYFMQYAEKFTDKHRGNSEEAYIIRIKTKNRIDGAKAEDQGIGVPRFKMPRKLDKNQKAYIRKQYPGLKDADIIKALQKEYLEKQFDRLVKYFSDRYEDYLGRKVISSMAVTGFSMEVVKGFTG